MPSKCALVIANKIEQCLGRALTQEELYGCEELNINYFSNPIINYVDNLMKKKLVEVTFDLIYLTVMGGTFKNAYRRSDIIRIKGRLREVYDRIHAFVGDAMSNGELEAIIFLAQDCTDKELDAALGIARIRGIHHAKYVRAVIEGNRKAASRARALREFKQFVPDEYGDIEIVKVPRVDAIREIWEKRLKSVKEKIEIAKAELNARGKIRKRG